MKNINFKDKLKLVLDHFGCALTNDPNKMDVADWLSYSETTADDFEIWVSEFKEETLEFSNIYYYEDDRFENLENALKNSYLIYVDIIDYEDNYAFTSMVEEIYSRINKE